MYISIIIPIDQYIKSSVLFAVCYLSIIKDGVGGRALLLLDYIEHLIRYKYMVVYVDCHLLLYSLLVIPIHPTPADRQKVYEGEDTHKYRSI